MIGAENNCTAHMQSTTRDQSKHHHDSWPPFWPAVTGAPPLSCTFDKKKRRKTDRQGAQGCGRSGFGFRFFWVHFELKGSRMAGVRLPLSQSRRTTRQTGEIFRCPNKLVDLIFLAFSSSFSLIS
uniref:Uncharacterized protein n=1 Tax=Cannabis sativa TaxID=3483 RepID=A0A803QGF8_CANSA